MWETSTTTTTSSISTLSFNSRIFGMICHSIILLNAICQIRLPHIIDTLQIHIFFFFINTTSILHPHVILDKWFINNTPSIIGILYTTSSMRFGQWLEWGMYDERTIDVVTLVFFLYPKDVFVRPIPTCFYLHMLWWWLERRTSRMREGVRTVPRTNESMWEV